MVSPETEKKLLEEGWLYNHQSTLEEMLDWLAERGYGFELRLDTPSAPYAFHWGRARFADWEGGIGSGIYNRSEAVALAVLDVLAKEQA